MRHSERTAETVEEVTAIASELRDKWYSSDAAIIPWFRGHADAEWRLTPKFYRTPPIDPKTECEIREEFVTHAPAVSNVAPRNEWEWYFLMQHYGAPTRLLDWTDGALIALYFAVRENKSDRHAAVWVLDPWWLNWTVIRKDEVVPAGDPLLPSNRREQKWLPNRFGRSIPLPKLPIAVLPGHFDKRIGAQRSTFTIHGSDVDGLTTLANKDKYGLVKITIPSWSIAPIRRSLDTCGIDETSVFPDLVGLSRVVESRWKDETRHVPHRKVLTRLRPSKIHGVGVFALTDIRQGTKLFENDLEEMVWMKQDDTKKLPKELKQLYEDFAPPMDGRYGCPTNFNRLTMSWYLNESANPNVRCDNNYNFIAKRKIKKGGRINTRLFQARTWWNSMIGSAIIMVAATLSLALLTNAQNPSASATSASSTMTVTDQDDGKTIDLAKGRTLIVELSSNASTGYSWAVKGDPAPLKLVSSDYKQPEQSGKVGAPGAQQFRLKGTAPGTSTLKLVYRRPWEKSVAPARTFTLHVNVH
jgi:predicted secreted protein